MNQKGRKASRKKFGRANEWNELGLNFKIEKDFAQNNKKSLEK